MYLARCVIDEAFTFEAQTSHLNKNRLTVHQCVLDWKELSLVMVIPFSHLGKIE